MTELRERLDAIQKGMQAEPGREIDNQIAAQVMGWGIKKSFELGDLYVINEDNEMVVDNFNPSTDIHDAWWVLETLGGKGVDLLVYKNEDGDYQCLYWPTRISRSWRMVHKSAPMAICLAALKVKEHEVESLVDGQKWGNGWINYGALFK